MEVMAVVIISAGRGRSTGAGGMVIEQDKRVFVINYFDKKMNNLWIINKIVILTNV